MVMCLIFEADEPLLCPDIVLGIFDLYIEVAVAVEGAGIDQFQFRKLAAAMLVIAHQSAIGIFG